MLGLGLDGGNGTKMNFLRAMINLAEGEKVRLKGWGKSHYIHKDMSFVIYPENFEEEWEIYQEPQKQYSFMEILPFLKAGKKVKRKDWKCSIRLSSYTSEIIRYSNEPYEPWVAEWRDFEATDWIVVD